LPKHVIAEKLGLTPLTYGRIESNKQKFNVQPTTYQKITQWLATDTKESINKLIIKREQSSIVMSNFYLTSVHKVFTSL